MRSKIFLALLAAAIPAPALAAGDLLVAPTRVLLQGARGTEVILNNIGTEPATYRISLELRRMDAVGRLNEVDPATATAKEQAMLAMVSYAPRRVMLAPNQPQAIRIALRAPEGLPDGEYRAHMLFRAIPPAAAPSANEGKGVSIALTPIYGLTIPIIVRQGDLQATAALSNARKCGQARDGAAVAPSPETGPAFCVDISRTGGQSTYGRIRVTKAGVAKPLVEARGIAVYAEVAQRTVALPVDPAVFAQLSGPVRVEYVEDGDAGGGIIAELQAKLP